MANQYNVVQPWEAREKERDLYPHPITAVTQVILRNVCLLKYYEKATSLKGHSGLFSQLIHQWDAHQQDFHVDPNTWHGPIVEDIYFITDLSRRG